MKKKTLSLALALVMCLGLTVPAFAAGKTETYVDKEHNVTITMDGFLRKETHTYAVFRDEPVTLTIYVLADGSTITIEAINGAEYAPSGYDMEEWAYFEGKDYGNYAWESGGLYIWANGELDNRSGMGGLLEGPATGTVDKDEDGMVWVNCSYSIAWMNESDFVQLVPIDGKPTTPTEPEKPAEVKTADPTNDKLTVNGAAADPTVYKIDGSNYFKIRDVAAVLNGTEKQFAVGYDGEKNAVTATTGQGYDKQPGDLAGAPSGGSQSAAASNDAIYVNGEKITAEVYKIGGSNYFKLRDLGEALNFYVGWEAGRGVYIETDKPYSK